MGTYARRGRSLSSSFASRWIRFTLLGAVLSVLIQGVSCDVEPTESQCRSYIEKALKEQEHQHEISEDTLSERLIREQEENPPTDEGTDSTEGSIPNDGVQTEDERDDDDDDRDEEGEVKKEDDDDDDGDEKVEDQNADEDDDDKTEQQDDEESEKDEHEVEGEEKEGDGKGDNDNDNDDDDAKDDQDDQEESEKDDGEGDKEEQEDEKGQDEREDEEIDRTSVDDDDDNDDDGVLERPIEIEVQEIEMDDKDDDTDDDQEEEDKEVDKDNETPDDKEDEKDEEGEEKEDNKEEEPEEEKEDNKEEEPEEEKEDDEDNKEDTEDTEDDKKSVEVDDEEDKKDDLDEEQEQDEEKETEEDGDKDESKTEKDEQEPDEESEKAEVKESESEGATETEEAEGSTEDTTEQDSAPEEEELIKEVVIPDNLRPRDHINKILKLDEDSGLETILEKAIDTTLKSLKGLYDNAIKPLEMLYKYRDLSNRHFGDPEIFSKPLILFMGPWSGGKSSTINYLLDHEYSHISLRTGAEPSPAYFNILMYGEEEEVLDGTQLAADWTFSGLQKFGQSLLDRLKGIKLPNKLLEKVNIVEIPGILEIRKQVQRLFPFNDACQWFIDRADIIFLVYDPSKLDVGPETEAILDQLKGREYQTRIILNKADQVKPEELMRVQGTLIWNISPLMSSSEPPIMYSTSLWSMPYESGAPTRLLQAQERAFLRDLREAVDKRVENKIASARRFAVRVRNHAKMVDCYLTTYYNHKSIFGNRKKISDDIIEYPQKYHIYEGLSTLTNISRYDLPDPDVYRDFFKINPLYEFKKLSETCTYFRGCPINKLDVAIAYDLPELVGRYKKAMEAAAKEQTQKEQKENS